MIRAHNTEFDQGKKGHFLAVNCFADRGKLPPPPEQDPKPEPEPAAPAPKAPDTYPDWETWKSDCSKVYSDQGECRVSTGSLEFPDHVRGIADLSSHMP